ncbi:MAG: polysaccharide deacetylase family protein [Acidobacteriota bacterium]|nr:polysaccharide deacetylase family protein [Acidobacteriota bacterium]
MKPLASLSLDLDNKWSYMKTHGDAGWEQFPSYLDQLVPRVLDFLEKRALKITFFVVGQDAALDKNRESLAALAAAGHEIGNHSFNHEPWLHLYSAREIEDELKRAEEAIFAATGVERIKGFRGPGFSLSQTVLETLAQRGYEYDCSTFPTYLAPLARAFYFMTAPKMTAEEKAKRKQLFGKFSDGFQPLKPYVWQFENRNLVEIPVTTFPLLKTPIHASYILYLSSFSRFAARQYFEKAIKISKRLGYEPSILLHPLDFLSADDAPELKFFPAMNLPLERKLETMSEVFDCLEKNFRIVNMSEHARSVRQTRSLAVRTSFERGSLSRVGE